MRSELQNAHEQHMSEAALSSCTEKFFLGLYMGHGPGIRFLKDLNTQGVSKILGTWASIISRGFRKYLKNYKI